MQDLVEKIDAVGEKAKVLLEQRNRCVEEIKQLKKQLADRQSNFEKLKAQFEALEEDNQHLKTANAMLGSNDHKRETKLKINSLIREIDQCIVQLSE